jgi:hypothetical protein
MDEKDDPKIQAERLKRLLNGIHPTYIIIFTDENSRFLTFNIYNERQNLVGALQDPGFIHSGKLSDMTDAEVEGFIRDVIQSSLESGSGQ